MGLVTRFSSALCLLVLSLVASAQPLSERAFTEEVAAAFRKKVPALRVTVSNALELQIVNSRGEPWTFRLAEMYDSYLRRPSERQELIDRYVVRMLAQDASALLPMQQAIVPTVRRRAFVAQSKVHDLIVDELNADWVIVYMLGPSDRAEYLTNRLLVQMNLPRTSVRGIAVSNLRRLANNVQIQPNALFSVVSGGGDFDTGLLLLDELWQGGRIVVDGDTVVAILEPNGLLVAGSRNTAGLAKIRELASLGSGAADRGGAGLLVFRQGRFQRFDP